MRTSERGKMRSLWLPLMAVVLFLVPSMAFAKLLDLPSITMPIIEGGALGLVLAALSSGTIVVVVGSMARLSWLGRLIVFVPWVLLPYWFVMPLIKQFFGDPDPLFAGFDGSNLMVLV